MKRLLFAILTLLLYSSGFAQEKPGAHPLKRVIILNPTSYETGNGACVVWHPKLQRYYAARAGNVDYPLDYFDASGKKLSPDTLRALFDMRGMWYDPMTQRISFNGYNDFGWASYKLNAKGNPSGLTTIAEGMNQPNYQSSGCFDAKKRAVYFLSGMSVFSYNAIDGTKNGENELINFRNGINKAHEMELMDGDDLPEFYNPTMIFTGIPGQEFGLLNVDSKEIDLFSMTTGMRTSVWTLPAELDVPTFLNIAYTNKTCFIYSKSNGQWFGYR